MLTLQDMPLCRKKYMAEAAHSQDRIRNTQDRRFTLSLLMY